MITDIRNGQSKEDNLRSLFGKKWGEFKGKKFTPPTAHSPQPENDAGFRKFMEHDDVRWVSEMLTNRHQEFGDMVVDVLQVVIRGGMVTQLVERDDKEESEDEEQCDP